MTNAHNVKLCCENIVLISFQFMDTSYATKESTKMLPDNHFDLLLWNFSWKWIIVSGINKAFNGIAINFI
jgi:hypothetical protein